MNSEAFSKLRHDLKSDLAAVFEAAKVLEQVPGTPEIVARGLNLIHQRQEKVLTNLEALFELAKSGTSETE